MCNYFSFGVESKIGIGFDLNRTEKASMNKCVYCWEGFKRMFYNPVPGGAKILKTCQVTYPDD